MNVFIALKGTHFFILFTMGKVKLRFITYYLITDTSTKVLQKCLLSGPPRSISFYTKLLNLISCHGNRNVKVAKKYIKII